MFQALNQHRQHASLYHKLTGLLGTPLGSRDAGNVKYSQSSQKEGRAWWPGKETPPRFPPMWFILRAAGSHPA
jgi:hypothetical protein